METEKIECVNHQYPFISSQLRQMIIVFQKNELDLSDLFKDCAHEILQSVYPERQFIGTISPDMDVKGDALCCN